jgi:CBS domain-containing protein
MSTVNDVLAGKTTAYVHTIAETASVLDAVKAMNQYRIGCLVVTREDTTISGIIAERDVIRRIGCAQEDLSRVPVSDLMEREVIVCTPTDGLDAVRSVMRTQWIRQVPVVDPGGGLVGIISLGDLNAFMLSEGEVEITFLHDYIEGKVR